MITYALEGKTAVLTMDDGKRNVVNPAFAQSMHEALDRAEADKAGAVVVTGRPGVFSAGFDLNGFQQGPEIAFEQVRIGFEMLVRLFAFPRPMIGACTGHGIGMGAFLLMACDHRVAVDGEFKFSMPESRLGMELSDLLVAIAKARISPQYLTRMAVLSEDFDPKTARAAGLLDEFADEDQVMSRALEVANGLATMPNVFGSNKKQVRKDALAQMRLYLDTLGK
jgi:enoyl-CoA hydratase